MGEIYKAFDPRLNRFVAIKVLPAGMSADPARRRRFVQEAQAASGLNHPNIITIYDVVLEQETEFILMEFVAGKTLLDLIPAGGFPVPQVLDCSVQIASALSAAHAAGIIHRDLKPGNVMVTDAGLVKVLDFGLAKLESNAISQMGDETETIAAEALTVEGSILGTVNYMSPEQAQGFRVDARSDIFSFGVLLYEMVTGIRPFSGASPISTLSAVLRDEARPVGEIKPGVPAALQEVISRCLRKEPNDRWQTMQEVHALLGAIKPEPRLVPKQARSRGVAWLLAAGCVIAALAAAGRWLERRPTPGPGANLTTPNPARRAELPAAPSSAPVPAPATPAHPDLTEQATPQPPPVEPAKADLHTAVTIPDGSPLSLTLADDIPASAPVGTPIHFTVSKDLEVGGTVVIHKGALATGEIAQEAKKKLLVFGGKMMMRLITVEAADGHSLNIRATPARRADGPSWRPVDAVGLARPKGMAAAAGTQYLGFIDGEQTATAKK